MSADKTVVISCAGMGKRLGIGVTKALVEVEGTPLIIRHLQQLNAVDDVRVVVGYQAERVIDVVRAYRNDVTFVFNHDYMNNGTGASVSLAARHANELVLTLDGDLLVHPDDMHELLQRDDEFVGVTSPGTDGPVLVKTQGTDAVGFSRDEGDYEWTGVMQIRADRLAPGDGHAYQLIEGLLPLPCMYLRTKEIDTPNDYEHAVRWVKNGFSDERIVGAVSGRKGWSDLVAFATEFAAQADNTAPMPRLVAEMLPESPAGQTEGNLDEGRAKPDIIGACRSMSKAGASLILLFDMPSQVAKDRLGTALSGPNPPLVIGCDEITQLAEEDRSMRGVVARVLQKAME